MYHNILHSAGFCGSRHLSGKWWREVRRVARAVSAAGISISVGCTRGADAAVRQACPSATVFSVRSGQWGKDRSAYARRSVALVRSLPENAVFAGFVEKPCPCQIWPASHWISGQPVSGSWSSVALAAGRGLTVFVFWCSDDPPALPRNWGGTWVQVGHGLFAGAWRFSPGTVRQRLLF